MGFCCLCTHSSHLVFSTGVIDIANTSLTLQKQAFKHYPYAPQTYIILCTYKTYHYDFISTCKLHISNIHCFTYNTKNSLKNLPTNYMGLIPAIGNQCGDDIYSHGSSSRNSGKLYNKHVHCPIQLCIQTVSMYRCIRCFLPQLSNLYKLYFAWQHYETHTCLVISYCICLLHMHLCSFACNLQNFVLDTYAFFICISCVCSNFGWFVPYFTVFLYTPIRTQTS